MAIGQLSSAGMAFKSNKDAQKQTARASADLTRRMEMSQHDAIAARPQAAQARMQAMRQKLGLLSPLNDMAGEITGGRKVDLAAAGANPMPIRALPSQMSTMGANGKPDLVKLRAHGIDPNDPQAAAKLAAAMGNLGYDVSSAIGSTPVSNRGVVKVTG